VGNPDKGTLPLEEIRSRVRQFVDANLPVVVTRAGSPSSVAHAAGRQTNGGGGGGDQSISHGMHGESLWTEKEGADKSLITSKIKVPIHPKLVGHLTVKRIAVSIPEPVP
jgi:hypothetical protein